MNWNHDFITYRRVEGLAVCGICGVPEELHGKAGEEIPERLAAALVRPAGAASPIFALRSRDPEFTPLTAGEYVAYCRGLDDAKNAFNKLLDTYKLAPARCLPVLLIFAGYGLISFVISIFRWLMSYV